MKKEFRTKNLLSESTLAPKFVEFDEGVFLAERFSEEKYRMMMETARQADGNRASVEFSINSPPICDLFLNPPPDPTPRLMRETGEMLRKLWMTLLKTQYPGRSFEVRYFVSADHPLTSEITFFQGPLQVCRLTTVEI